MKRILEAAALVAIGTGIGILSASFARGQTPAAPAADTGLKVLSATIDPKTRTVSVEVENTTDKTIVAYAILYQGYTADNRPAELSGGILTDRNYPENTNHLGWILPGQVATIQDGYAASPAAFSVEARVTALVFEDDSTQGEKAHAGIMFNQRRENAKDARERAAKESGAKRAELEQKAEWYEAHDTPKEAK